MRPVTQTKTRPNQNNNHALLKGKTKQSTFGQQEVIQNICSEKFVDIYSKRRYGKKGRGNLVLEDAFMSF
jgi:hypothetical protein